MRPSRARIVVAASAAVAVAVDAADTVAAAIARPAGKFCVSPLVTLYPKRPRLNVLLPGAFHYQRNFMSFSQLGVHTALTSGCESLGYTEPTPIQKQAIPVILSGADL